MEQLATSNRAQTRLRALLARHRARRGVAGVTLVEVMIVVAIMAMVAGGVMVFALPRFREAQVSTAKQSALAMRRAVQDWQRLNNESTCPTVSQLIQGKHLDSASNTDDPWGQPYTLVCTDDDVFVISPGPDKKKDTKDDVSVPARAAEAGEG
jgi:general secretion pathway protein G